MARMEMEEAIMLVGSELQIPTIVMRQINEIEMDDRGDPDYGAWIEALLCIHDGVTPRSVLEQLIIDKTDVGKLHELRNIQIRGADTQVPASEKSSKRKRKVSETAAEPVVEKIPADEETEPRQQMAADSLKPQDVIIDGIQVSVTPVRQQPQKDGIFTRCKNYFRATRAPESTEERFRKYADLVDEEHMTKEQQLQVVAAINADLPYSVVKVLANSKYDPEIMEYLAATYLHMTRGTDMSTKKEEE